MAKTIKLLILVKRNSSSKSTKKKVKYFIVLFVLIAVIAASFGTIVRRKVEGAPHIDVDDMDSIMVFQLDQQRKQQQSQ